MSVDLTDHGVKRVLVIEDEAIVGLELEEHLSELGYRVVGLVASYDEAIAAAEREPPELVIADIRIAGDRNGLEAGAELCRRYGSRLLVITAHSGAATIRLAESFGALGVLHKPFRAEDLRTQVERVAAGL